MDWKVWCNDDMFYGEWYYYEEEVEGVGVQGPGDCSGVQAGIRYAKPGLCIKGPDEEFFNDYWKFTCIGSADSGYFI